MLWNGRTAIEGLSGSSRNFCDVRNAKGHQCFKSDQSISANWLLNVLHLLSTKVRKGHRQELST